MSPGDQLAGAKWFGDIVICPQFEAMHNIVLLAAHSEQDDRGVCLLPDALANSKAIEPGHVDVQDDQVGLFIGPALQSRLTIVGQGYPETLTPKGKGQNIGQHTIIVNNECFHLSSA
jgi:hypothetical protein